MGGGGSKQSSSLWETLSFSNPVRVVMLGLDSAGKSTVLYKLKFDQYVNTVPTIGFNCEKIKGQCGKSKGVNFMIWDVGGQDKLRPLWRAYTRQTDGIVFVIDSVDSERFDEAKMELQKTARLQENMGVPILVIANKQDMPGARPEEEINKSLSLSDLGPAHLWQVQETCAITGEGLNEAIDILYTLILKRRKTNKQQKNAKKK